MGRSSTFVYLCFKDVDGVIWYDWILKRSSVQFSLSVVSDSLWPHGLQHARFPCLSTTPRAYSNSCPLSQWCHPTTSSSVVPFSSHLQSFPATGSFPMSQFFPSNGQSIGASALASVLPMNIQGWFPLELMDLISLLSRDSQESSPVPQFESINSLTFILLCGPTLTSVHDYWKNHSIDYMDLCHQNDVTLVCCIVSSSMLLMFNFYLYWGIYCTQSLKSNNIKVCFLSHHLIFHSLGLIILNLFSYCIQ